MKIVYGVSGEGLGHVFEAIEITTRLRREGHSVKVLTFGDRACRSLAAFEPTRIEGVHLRFGPNGLSLRKTFPELYRCIPFYFRNGARLMREIADFRPDIFITAYEPFTTFASHWFRKPLISMDNQNELRFLKPPSGPGAFAFHLARWTTLILTHGAAAYIVKSFRRRSGGPGGVHFVAPIVQGEIRSLSPTYGPHILVYLTKPNPGLIEILKSFNESFIVYCHGRTGEDHNIIYRAQGPGYLSDLATCKAIIGTTGFSLIADALYLRKPYYGVPLKKQFEQTNNAHFLRASGLGDFSETVCREDLERFFAKLPHYREQSAKHDFDPAEQEETLCSLVKELAGKSAEEPTPGVTAICPRT